MELRDLETELVKLMEEKASKKKPILMHISLIIFVTGVIIFFGRGYELDLLISAGGLVGLFIAYLIDGNRHYEVDKKIRAIQEKINKAKQEQP